MIWIFWGCGEKVETPCSEVVFYQDLDEDGFGDPFVHEFACVQPSGFVNNPDDCDDVNAGAYPGAVWYRDADTDGFGDPEEVLISCIPPLGYLTTADDCDDLDATKNPEENWYIDVDGDGFGSLEEVPSCTAEEGSVPNPDDCDDNNPFVHPEGIEVCDEIDNDCDGLIDDDDGDLDAFTTVPKFMDEDGDGFGSEELLGYFCLYSGEGALVSGDCDDENPGIRPDVIELNDEIDQNCDGESGFMDASSFTNGWASPVSGAFGLHVRSMFEEGEESPALLFSMHSYDELKGGAYFVPAGTPSTEMADVSDVAHFWTGTVVDQRIGASLIFAGDMTGDGVEDVLIGGGFLGDPRAGFVHLISTDRESGPIEDEPLITGSESSYFANALLPLGDIDSDGFDDVIITARGDDLMGNNKGVIHILQGGIEPTITKSIYGLSNGHNFGFSVTEISDFDGDGIVEYAVSSLYADVLENDAGTTYLIPRNLLLEESLELTTLTQFHGTSNKEHSGWALADAGDFNGDGRTDLLIGAPDYDGVDVDVGRAFLVHGGSTDPSLDAAAHIFYGHSGADSAGEYVHRIGDVNGDGMSDIAIIAHKNDEIASNSGALYGVFGGLEAASLDLHTESSFTMYGATSNDQLGRGLSAIGDINEDGYDDFWMASTSHIYGKAYLVLGSPSP